MIINRPIRILLLLLLLLSFKKSIASHMYGGEISWKCLPDGKYQFYVEVYVECLGIQYRPKNPNEIRISGYPLPQDENNNSFNSFNLSSYSDKWLAKRQRDLSPTCSPQYTHDPLSCENQDDGSVKVWLYKSLPITLKGIPPANGWTFYYNFPSSRVQFDNIQNGGLTLRAIMYPIKKESSQDYRNANPCMDSSPEFKSLPVSYICRGNEFIYNLTAVDYELDSIVYSWGKPYGFSANNNYYHVGFNYDNPTPDTSFNDKNIPSTLDSITGSIRMKINNGFDDVDKYLFIVKVDSYRYGSKISTVYRDLPLYVFQCPKLRNGKSNNPPEVKVDGKLSENFVIEVIAGVKIDLPIEVSDTDKSNNNIFNAQRIGLVPNGLMFTEDRTYLSSCDSSIGLANKILVEPCAFLETRSPNEDTTILPPSPSIYGISNITTNLVWQTDCKHIQTKKGPAGTNESIYRFVMRVSDDFCPIPALNYPSITVKIKERPPLTAPIMKGINVDLDGQITYQWVPSIDSSSIFTNHIVEYSGSIDGTPPIWRDTLNNELLDYKQSNMDSSITIYTSSDPPKVDPKYVGKDVYVRMSTAFSICKRIGVSHASEPVKIIELESKTFNNVNTNQLEIKLNWNAAKPKNAATHSYYIYESKTKFYIWRNDSSKVKTLENWRLLANTYETTYNLPLDACGESAAFRVEARDTVITWKQGFSPSSGVNGHDTLVFSTFSLIDTLLLKEDLIPPNEFILDAVSYDVKSDEVEASWSIPNPGDIDSIYFITDLDTTTNPTQYRIIGKEKWGIGDKKFRFPKTKLDASNQVVFLGAIALDFCGNQILPSEKNIHNTLDVDVEWRPCDSTMLVNWNEYNNVNATTLEYNLYVDSLGNNNYKRVSGGIGLTSNTFSHKTLSDKRMYRYIVKAEWINGMGQHISSASNVDSAFSDYEDKPKLGYLSNVTVVNSEYTQINYIRDTLTPVKNYVIYRGSDSTKLYSIEDVSAQSIPSNEFVYFDHTSLVNNQSYYYQINAINFCNNKFHESNYGRSLFLSVESGQESLKNILKWNNYIKWDSKVSHYNIYRGVDRKPTDMVFKRIEGGDLTPYVFADEIIDHTDAIGEYCYQIEAVKELTINEITPVVARSNLFCLTIKPLLYVPNAFSPNGVNKIFKPKGQFFNHGYYELRIYNRAGQEIFSSRDINQGWDGTYNGRKVNQGSYIYIIRMIDAGGEEYLRKGTVTVVY